MIKRGFNKIGDQLKIQLNHNMMERELVFGDDELRQSFGVQSSTMKWWRDVLAGKAVCTPLDKRKQDVVIMCPHYWQREFINWYNDQDVEDIMPTVEGVIDEKAQVKLIEAIEDVRKKLTYTGAVKRRSHRWGSFSFFHKASGFSANDDWSEASFIERKFRPIGSYTKHGLKNVLSVVCKALFFMLQVVILHKM